MAEAVGVGLGAASLSIQLLDGIVKGSKLSPHELMAPNL